MTPSDEEITHCPKCNADFQGKEIPEGKRELYGGFTHYSRLIGISDMEQDRIVRWQCPDCKHEWPRG